MRSNISTIAIVAPALVFAIARSAEAHSVNKQFGDFYGGMLHPLTAIEHLVPIIALGLLAGQQGKVSARWILLLFPAGLLVGATLAHYVAPGIPLDLVNRLSFILLGGLIASAAPVPLPAVAAVALIMGLAHGYENTCDVASSVAMQLFVPGVVVSGLALVAICSAISVKGEADWQKIVIRVVGSWVAAIGILVLGLA